MLDGAIQQVDDLQRGFLEFSLDDLRKALGEILNVPFIESCHRDSPISCEIDMSMLAQLINLLGLDCAH
jgi:hypothetical protein